MIVDYLDDLIPAIRQAIIDDVDTVRSSASLVVALLHSTVGSRATTDIVKWVLERLNDDDEEEDVNLYIRGLEQLVAKQPAAVFPIVLSALTKDCARSCEVY